MPDPGSASAEPVITDLAGILWVATSPAAWSTEVIASSGTVELGTVTGVTSPWPMATPTSMSCAATRTLVVEASSSAFWAA